MSGILPLNIGLILGGEGDKSGPWRMLWIYVKKIYEKVNDAGELFTNLFPEKEIEVKLTQIEVL